MEYPFQYDDLPDSSGTDEGPRIPDVPPRLTLSLPDDPASISPDWWLSPPLQESTGRSPSFSRPNTNGQTYRVPLRLTSSPAGRPVRPNSHEAMAALIRSHLGRSHSNSARGGRSEPPFLPTALDAFRSPVELAMDEDRFFVPSYLINSVYMQRLETEYMAKARARQSKKVPSDGIDTNNNSDLASAPLPSGSHRGLSHRVIERSPIHDAPDSLPPLPSKWNNDDMWSGIEVDHGNIVRYTAPKTYHERDHEASAVRADHHMPPQCGIYYYEVTILDSRRDETTIAIGFSTKAATLSRPIGWEPESWAYHGDDGRCFTAQNVGKVFGPTFNKNDVIGCGVNFKNNSAFFTRNGILLGEPFHDVVKGDRKLYPAISLKRLGEKVKTNFGQDPFLFNINQMMENHRRDILEEISTTSTLQLEPAMSESDLLQALVLQFLQHDGYVDTARAFAGEMRDQKRALHVDPDTKFDGISIKDDEDANNRQLIRSAILEGDIDKAFKYTSTFYPKVLPANKRVHFNLRCRMFIEMVREAAELSAASQPSAKSHRPSSDSDSQTMDLDQDGGEQQKKLRLLEQDILIYGQGLQADYAFDDSDDYASALQEMWALMAYKNPLKEPHVKHLLDQQGRVTVAEQLNSAILLSLGKSSRASLENVYAQTTALLDELQRDGGDGAFVSVDDCVGDIPDHSAT